MHGACQPSKKQIEPLLYQTEFAAITEIDWTSLVYQTSLSCSLSHVPNVQKDYRYWCNDGSACFNKPKCPCEPSISKMIKPQKPVHHSLNARNGKSGWHSTTCVDFTKLTSKIKKLAPERRPRWSIHYFFKCKILIGFGGWDGEFMTTSGLLKIHYNFKVVGLTDCCFLN